VQVAGKTGTAQLGDGSDPHSWFIGYAPADSAPRIAIAVVVEHGGSGGGRAAQIAGQLMGLFLELSR
jgi:peptidoglycan glycosyltransferase